jgi:hypothetical protein
MWVTKGKTLERITNRRNTSNVTESASRDPHGMVLMAIENKQPKPAIHNAEAP